MCFSQAIGPFDKDLWFSTSSPIFVVFSGIHLDRYELCSSECLSFSIMPPLFFHDRTMQIWFHCVRISSQLLFWFGTNYIDNYLYANIHSLKYRKNLT